MPVSVLLTSNDPRCEEMYARIARYSANGDEDKLFDLWINACKLESDPQIGGRSRWLARQVREYLESMFLVAS